MTVDSKKLDKNVKEKLTAELIEVLLTDPDTSIPVCVWLKDIDEEAVLKTMPLSLSQGVQAQTSDDEFHLQSYLVEKRSYYTNAYECHNYGIIDSLLNIEISQQEMFSTKESTGMIQPSEEVLFVSSYAPMCILELSAKQVLNIAENTYVLRINIVEENVPYDLMAYARQSIQANYVRDTYGYTGSGVAIGMIEARGIPNVNLSEFTSANIVTRGTDTTVSDHASMVAQVLVGKTYGMVPNSTLYAVKYSNFYSDIEWLLNQGVSVINCSMSCGKEKEYTDEDMWIDHLDMNHNVLFVAAAGNDGEVVTPAMSYNAITVGAYDDRNSDSYTDDIIMDYTQNGIRVWSAYLENDGLAEKPDLLAPGRHILMLDGLGDNSGTSLAAPLVVGTAAMMIQANNDLVDEPGQIKSILLASAFRKLDISNYGIYDENNTLQSAWMSDIEGVGKLDTKNAMYVVHSNRYKYEYLYSSMFPYTSSFYVDSTSSQVRVALCWLKQNVVNSANASDHISGDLTEARTLSNLDLEIYDPYGNLVGYSRLRNGNVEVVEFTPGVTGWFTIKVLRTSGVTEKDFIYLAWW